MNRYSLATICLMAAGLACPCQTAHADGFEVAGLRSLARGLGVGFGPGYHTKPCIKHLAQHYDRSVQGKVHPAHQLTPLHCLNKSNALRQRINRHLCAPNTAAHTMPTLCRQLPSPAVEAHDIQPIPYQPIWQPAANGTASSHESDNDALDFQLDEISESDESGVDESRGDESRVIDETEEAKTDELQQHDLETKYRIERLPRVDIMSSTLGEVTPVRDVIEPLGPFEDVELQNNLTESDDAWDPLQVHPLWEENGPAQPRL